MSEQKKQPAKNPETTSVDWAERLKASMNHRPADTDAAPSTREDDDLSALLRAQLGKNSSDASPVDVLDTSEFEDLGDDDEDQDEFEEDFEEDIDEEDPEENRNDIDDNNIDEEEFDEDLPDEDSEDDTDEDYEEDVDEDYPAEEFDEDIPDEDSEDDTDETYEEDVDEDYPAEEFDEDIPDEDSVDDTDEGYEEDVDEDYPEEEFDEDIPDEDSEDDTDETYEEDVDEDYPEEEFDEDIPDEDSEDDTDEGYEEDVDEDYPEEEFDEDIPDEDSEDDTDEDYEDDVDEDYPEEEFDEDIPNEDSEDDTDEDYEEDVDEDYPEEEFDEDIPDEDSEDDTDEDYEEDIINEDLDEYIEENTEDALKENEGVVEETSDTDGLDGFPDPLSHVPTPPPPPARTEYHRPAADAWTDDLLNAAPSHEEMGGRRLHELAQENRRLVDESRTSANSGPISESISEPMPEPADTRPPSEPPARSEKEKETTRAASIGAQLRDPLQLGLDDISLTVKTIPTPKPAKSAPRAVEPPPAPRSEPEKKVSDYTEHMADKGGEAASLSDADLYMRLGYEEALSRTDDQMRLEQLRAETSAKRSPRSSGEHPTVQVNQEYRGREDTVRVEDAYSRSRHKNAARLIVASMGALVALAYDLLAALPTATPFTALVESAYYVPMSLLWTLLICLPFLSRLGRGLKSLLDFEPTRYAVSAMALLVTVIHGIIGWVMGPTERLPLFGGVALLMLAVAALSELLVTEGEYRAFTVASSGKTAHILTDETTPASATLSATDGKVFTVVRAGRIADYFARTQRYNPYMGRLNYLLPVTLLGAIACAGLEVALGGNLHDSVQVFTATYLTCLPSAYLVAMTLPLCSVNGHLRQKGSAVIGAAAPADYAGKGAARVIFADGDALKALYRKDITLRGDANSEEYRRMADVVFRLLNTPLAVEPVLREGKIDNYRIEIAETDEQYMRLYLVDTEENGTTEIMMGSHNALTRRGVRLPKINMEQRYKKSEGSHVLYLAFNRSFHLAYAVEYRVRQSFARVVTALNDLGYETAVSSFDPLVDPDIEDFSHLRKKRRLDVLRPSGFESIRGSRSGGLIATGRSLDLLHPLNACHAMLRAYRRNHLSSWLGLLLGIGLMTLAICLGGEGLLLSATVALWQLIQLGVTLWISLASAGGKALDRESQKDSKNSESGSEAENTPSESPDKQTDHKRTKQTRK